MTTNPAAIVHVINDELKDGWAVAGLTPSAVASDSEWQRRVMLSLVGRVPHADEVVAFQAEDRPDKRIQLVERLLHDPGYVSHWTTVWSNLLIGRNPPEIVDRDALEDFLANSFAENRPWNEVAFDLIAAVGDSRENGAANFLLAHLNNQAVPATAFTARLFLGTQVQCTQCHDHPFNDWKQNEFWELNSFFHQTTIAEHRGRDPKTGTQQMERELVTQAVGGPTFYESRRGVMRVAYPRYRGVVISAEPDVDRRRELARLMTDSDDHRFARAFVNRIWAHLFGAGFTTPVDDMGPHNPPTHPELLEQLTQAFVASGYDFQQLLRWITTSDAYQRTTAFSEDNQSDDPSIGASPWFSRVYVQPMTPEQVYDSLQVLGYARMASNDLGRGSDGRARRERREWINSFIFVRETEENDEASTFDGTITRALTMMNGELIDRALAVNSSTFLGRVLQEPGTDADRINDLCRAALSRNASRKELAAFTRQIQHRRSQALRTPAAQQAATAEAFQDILWAYLNSNEFILLH